MNLKYKYRYHRIYREVRSKQELIDMMKRDIKIANFWGSNPDRIESIKEAGDTVADERGWILNVFRV